jgi:hypothetical protein
VASTNSEAEITRTEQLVWECSGQVPAEAPQLGQVHCAGYISGLLDMYALMSSPKFGGKAIYCIPAEGISNDQAAKVFMKWANEHPEQLNESARMSFLIALHEAFPCAQ